MEKIFLFFVLFFGCQQVQYPLNINILNELNDTIEIKVFKSYFSSSEIELEILFQNRTTNNITLEFKDNVYIKIGDNYFSVYSGNNDKNFSEEIYLEANTKKTIQLKSYIGDLDINKHLKSIGLVFSQGALDNVSLGNIDILKRELANIKEISLLSLKKESQRIVEKSYYLECLNKRFILRCKVDSCDILIYKTQNIINKIRRNDSFKKDIEELCI